VDADSPQELVAEQVAEPRDQPLIHQRRLDLPAAPTE
jgi:hypothetical protein